MKNTVVVTHYDMDISWIDEIRDKNIDIEIYSNSGNFPNLERNTINYHNPLNLGREAHLYLTYIINNYNKLPDNILFLHSHKVDWSQDFSLPFIIDNIKWDSFDYFNIASREHYNTLFTQGDYGHGSPKEWMINSWKIFEDKYDFPKEIYYYAGGQFKVNKKLILQYDISFYKKLDDWLLNTELPDWISARIFEYTWHLIFTKNPIDEKLENHKIFNI